MKRELGLYHFFLWVHKPVSQVAGTLIAGNGIPGIQ